MTTINESLLDEHLGKLESARTWSPRVISKLENFIRTADDYDLFRVNPIQYATEKNLAESEAIDLFLHSAKLGLFEMEWHLVCPGCGHVVESLRNMHKLHSAYICNQCAFEANVSLDDYIQVAFTISRSVREIIFHNPESLSAEDLFYKYNLCRGTRSFVEGKRQEEMLHAVTKLVTYLEPGEKRTIEFPTEPGAVLISRINENSITGFLVADEQAPARQTLTAQFTDGSLKVLDHEVTPATRLDFGYAGMTFDQLGSLLTGSLTVDIENHLERRVCFWLAMLPGQPSRTGVSFDPFLSGKRLITTQTFRNLFRSETVSDNEGIGVKDITFLFTDLKGSTALYDQIGDPKAYYLVRQHFDTLGNIINHYEGATVKTIGDAVMATFMTPLDAVRASLEMLHDIGVFNSSISDKLVLKIGIHTGHSIVVSLNDRIDYFGQTVNIAARVQALADADQIYISENVYSFPGVREAIAHCEVVPEQALVKGVSEKLQVYKLAVRK
jgi:class 3 adenylate cyclase